MSKPTIEPCLKKKFSTDKFGIINFRLTENRKSKYVSLKETIKEKHWNPKTKEVRSSYSDNERLNKLIRDKKKEIESLYHKTETIEGVKQQHNKSFLKFLNSHLAHLLQRKQIGTYKSYKTSYNQLKSFVESRGKTDLLFSDLSPLFMTTFESWLLHQDVKNNSVKKYISSLKKAYKLSVKMNIHLPTNDPFILFENFRLAVIKNRLVKRDVDKILLTKFPEDEPLYQTRNLFLFQIFAQGLRVSDLLTLRFGNIQEGRIKFAQLKTKKTHDVLLSAILINILKDYIPGKCAKTYNEKYIIKMKEKKDDGTKEEMRMTYEELKQHYKNIADKFRAAFMKKDPKAVAIVESWKELFDNVQFKMSAKLLFEITSYAKENANKFIFPLLRNEDFKDVEFNANTTLTIAQYNQLSSRTAIYNKSLKELQKTCKIDVVLTSHISRHTYTNIMLESTNRDVYAISKSLGHQRLSATEHYISEFSIERVDETNTEMNKMFVHV